MTAPACICARHCCQVQCPGHLNFIIATPGPPVGSYSSASVCKRSSALATAAGADSRSLVSTTRLRALTAAASVTDSGLSLQSDRQHAVTKRRRRQTAASSSTGTPAEDTSSYAPGAAQQQQQQRIRQQRKDKQQLSPQDAASLRDSLVGTLRLSHKAAEKVVAARASGQGIPKNTHKLCSNVQQLQQLLGEEFADLALTRFPLLLAYR